MATSFWIDLPVVSISFPASMSVTQGTSPWVDNITQFGSNNVVTGTGASGLGIPRVTVSNDSNILATQSGAWTTGRTWALLNSTDSVNAVQLGTWNINNISGTISLPTGASTETTLSALSAKFNSLGQKSMANSAPVVLASDQSSIPVTGTFFQTTQPISGTVTATPPANTSPATQNITIQDTGSTVTSGNNSQSIITGTPTPNSTANFTISAQESVRVQVTGTWTGTLQLELSMDSGTTWYINGGHQSGTVYNSATYTSNFESAVNVAGATNYRVRAIAAMTGTATIKVVESVNHNFLFIANPIKILDGSGGTTNQVNITAANAMKVDGSAVTQPISAASLPLPTGAGTSANQTTVISNQTNGTQKTQIVDGSGNVITSTQQTTKWGINTAELPVGLAKYSTSIALSVTGATGALSVIFSMRNASGSTKTVYIENFYLNIGFFQTSPVVPSLSAYGLFRFTTATPTGGTAATPVGLDSSNAATQVTDVRAAAAGLTTTGIVAGGLISATALPRALGSNAVWTFRGPAVVLAPGEGLGINLLAAAVAGDIIAGTIMWSER